MRQDHIFLPGGNRMLTQFLSYGAIMVCTLRSNECFAYGG
jgi:hypothetical protein